MAAAVVVVVVVVTVAAAVAVVAAPLEVVAFLGFLSSLFRPNRALLFFLLLIPQALHKDLGPAGPPRQRGVLVVPQSAQVLTWPLPSDE